MPSRCVTAVAIGYQNKIMHMNGHEATKALLIEIRSISKQYGGRVEADTTVITECLRMVMDKFSLLGINEIREAYRAYAAGEFQVEGAEMYGGVFNVANFSKVLSGWKNYRAKALAELLDIQEKERMERLEKKKREKAMADFDRQFPSLLEKGREEFESWQDVPVHWYDTAKRLKMLNVDIEEAMPIYEEAKKIVAAEQEHERGKMAMMSISERLLHRSFNNEQRAKNVARKITVFRKLIKDYETKDLMGGRATISFRK